MLEQPSPRDSMALCIVSAPGASHSVRPEAEECPGAAWTASARLRSPASGHLVNLLQDAAAWERSRAALPVLSSLLCPFPYPTAPGLLLSPCARSFRRPPS